ncbi:hypothetical protein BJ322DRAFT_844894 [Thelephora terrestris]|uniref:Uncharacterized protein n=1 Tax=Thelephora terrestris TaxID=56493 RepID=A0A9P6L5J2_9AGAM|nr:hypothetical protein BJ322DRAFT_844894 [Thelephora terrestris]
MSERRAPGSSLKGAELIRAICNLEELEKLAREEEFEEGGEASVGLATNVLSGKIKDLLITLRAKSEGALTFSFSSVDFDILEEKLRISPRDTLVKKGNHVNRAAESILQSGGRYMTSEDMYRHLNMLENLVPKANEAGARLWIDAIFFRVSAMVSGNKGMVLNLEQHVPAVGIPVPDKACSLNICGTIDYAALTTDPYEHESFIQTSHFQFIKHKNLNGLFVAEAKPGSSTLAQHVPRAVAEMYASAKYLNKGILRGALTNGHEWIFLIFYLDKDGIGGTYTTTPIIKIQVNDSYPFCILSPGPDIVAGILAYWIDRSFSDLDENDWFSQRARK